MHANFFFKGLAIGFSIAAPVGPIGVLCIRRSLADGAAAGLAAGLGAATADALYGCVAAFGLTAISSLLVANQTWLALIGGVFLCYLGARTFTSRPAEHAAAARGDGLLGTYASTFALTLTNPATILSFVAVFAGFGLGAGADYGAAAVLVAGVFTGSALWWLLLSGSVGALRARVGTGSMQTVNRLSGIVLFAFGVLALSRAATLAIGASELATSINAFPVAACADDQAIRASAVAVRPEVQDRSVRKGRGFRSRPARPAVGA
jgi:threonine/homoserine/homoserine lactone efflux protein